MSETALRRCGSTNPPLCRNPAAVTSPKSEATVMPRRRDRPRSRFERVTPGSYRPDPPRLLGVDFELGAEPANVLGDRRRVLPLFGRMPHLLEEERAGEDSAWRGREKREEVELASRQLDKVPAQKHSPRIEIEGTNGGIQLSGR